jgi:hypothetical protein
MKSFAVLCLALALAAVPAVKADKSMKVNKGEDASDLIPTTNKGFLKRFARADGSSVMDLEEGNFKLAIDAFRATIVLFYMPNSKLCDNLQPQFEKAAQIMEKRGAAMGGKADGKAEIGFAKVNLNQKRVIAEHFNITHVPHLRVFPRGDVVGYRYDGFLGSYNEGARTGYALVNYAMRLMGYPLNPLDDDVDLRNAKKVWLRHPTDAVVVGFFDDYAEGSAQFAQVQAYIDAAQDDKNTTYYLTKSPTLAKKFKVAATPALVMLKNYDERRHDMPVAAMGDAKAVARWVRTHAYPRVLPFDATSRTMSKKVWRSPWQSFLVLFRKAGKQQQGAEGADGDEGSVAALSEACRAMGDKHDRGALLCVDYPVDDAGLARGMPAFYGVTAADLPQAVVLHQQRAKLPIPAGEPMPEDNPEGLDFEVSDVYKMAGEPTAAALGAFAAAFGKGELAKHYRTQPAGAAGGGGAVKVLTGATLTEQLKELRAKGDSGLLVQIGESQIEGACGAGARLQPGCPMNFTAEAQSFASIAAGWPADSLAFGAVDSYLNDLEHFGPDTVLAPFVGGSNGLYGFHMKRGPAYVLFPPGAGEKPRVYLGKIADADELKKFLTGAAADDDEKAHDEL